MFSRQAFAVLGALILLSACAGGGSGFAPPVSSNAVQSLGPSPSQAAATGVRSTQSSSGDCSKEQYLQVGQTITCVVAETVNQTVFTTCPVVANEGWVIDPDESKYNDFTYSYSPQTSSVTAGEPVKTNVTVTYHPGTTVTGYGYHGLSLWMGPNEMSAASCSGEPGTMNAAAEFVFLAATPAPSPSPTPTLTAAQKILQAAEAFAASGQSTRGLYGAGFRNECVAADQKVLFNAGLAQMLNSNGQPYVLIQPFVNALLNSGYTPTTSPVPGDIVEIGADGSYGSGAHVGVYTGNGDMISNGSTPGTFTWGFTDGQNVSDQNQSEGGGSVYYYHHQ